MESGEVSIQTYLVRKSKQGDRLAQNELYRLHVKAMYNICRRMLGDDESAQDALQEGFIDAFTKIHTLKEDITFSAWLKRIVVNKCLNVLRAKKDYVLSLEQNEGSIDLVDEPIHDQSLIKQEAKKVMQALDNISEGCRTVFNLYLFDGYDHKEIAQILNISESASKAQYSKAKSKIRHILELERNEG